MNGPNDPTPEARFNKRIDVALAEFNALRTEMNQRTTGQAALIGLALTAVGVLFAVALDDKGDIRLLAGVPPLALLVSVLYAAESTRVARMGDYIRERLERPLQRWLDAGIPAWEEGVGERRKQMKIYARALVLDFPATLILFAASAGAQALIGDRDPEFERVDHDVWKLLWAVTWMVFIVPLVTVWVTRRNSAKAAEKMAVAAAVPASAPADERRE